MSETSWLTLLSIVMGFLVPAIGWLVLGHIQLLIRVGSIPVDLEKRLTTMETMFKLIGDKTAHELHSPHTPELDSLLEKHVARQLTKFEQVRLITMLNDLVCDLETPMNVRTSSKIVLEAVKFTYREAVVECPEKK